MIEARNPIITATGIEQATMTPEREQAIYEALDYGTPREAQTRLANFAVSLELRCDYTDTQHIYVATEEVGRGLLARHSRVRYDKYRDSNGLDGADLEMAILLTDNDCVLDD